MCSTHRFSIAIVTLLVVMLHVPDALGSTTQAYQQRVDFAFQGGSIPEYIEQLRQQVPDLNVVIMPRAEEANMPPMSVRNVRLETLVMLINRTAITGDDLTVHVSQVDDVFTVAAGAARHYRPGRPVRQTQEAVVRTRVFGLAHLIDDGAFEKDDILRGIEAVLEAHAEQHVEPTLRFHEATSLLIASGVDNQLDSIAETILQLQDSLEARHAREAYLSLEEHERIVSEWRERYEQERDLRGRMMREIREQHR